MPKGLLRSGITAAFDQELWRALQILPAGTQYTVDPDVKLSMMLGLKKDEQGTPGTPAAISAEKDDDGNIVLLVKIVNAAWLRLDGTNIPTANYNWLTDLSLQDLEVNGNVFSNLVPKTDDLYDLGEIIGGDKRWRDLFLSRNLVFSTNIISDGLLSGAWTGITDLTVSGGLTFTASTTTINYGTGFPQDILQVRGQSGTLSNVFRIASAAYSNTFDITLSGSNTTFSTTGNVSFVANAIGKTLTLVSPTLKLIGAVEYSSSVGGIPFAGIYVKDSVATISVDSDNPDVLVTQFTTDSESNNCTADAANNKITITLIGKYYVVCHASVSLNGGATVAVFLNGYLNGTIQPQLHSKRTVSTTDVGSVSFGSFIDVTAVPWDLDVRANIDSSVARTLTVEDIQLNVQQVGGT